MAAQSTATSTSTSMPPPPPPTMQQSASSSAPNTDTNTTSSETQLQFRTKSNPKSKSKSSQRKRLPIRTYHCAFCKQILLATTRDVERLPRREGGGLDRAVILPLPSEEQEQELEQEQEKVEEDEGEGGSSKTEEEEQAGNAKRENEGEEQGEQQHYTILLSTTSPSTQPTIIRRLDGFEKRFLIRCGRCRLACGYALDRIHFPQKKTEAEEGGKSDGGAEVVYILPGAVVETEDMMSNTENKIDMAGWERWEELVPSS